MPVRESSSTQSTVDCVLDRFCVLHLATARSRGRSNGLLACRRDVLGSRALQNLLRLRHVLGGVAVNRQEDSAFLDATFIPLGLVFGNAHADERADQASDGSADSSPPVHRMMGQRQ